MEARDILEIEDSNFYIRVSADTKVTRNASKKVVPRVQKKRDLRSSRVNVSGSRREEVDMKVCKECQKCLKARIGTCGDKSDEREEKKKQINHIYI